MRVPKHVMVAAALALSGLALGVGGQLSVVAPSDDTKSVFLKNFDPTPVVKQYVTLTQWGGGGSNAAGRRFPARRKDVSHKTNFDWTFRPDSGRYQCMMAALLEDARNRLATAHAAITLEQVEAKSFTITYRCGRATGRIRAESPRPAGTLDKFTVRVEEEWSPLGWLERAPALPGA